MANSHRFYGKKSWQFSTEKNCDITSCFDLIWREHLKDMFGMLFISISGII